MKKGFRRLLIFALCLLMALSSAIPLYAFESVNLPGEMKENPFYNGGEISFASLDQAGALVPSESREYNSNTYYTAGEQLYKIIRNNLKNRKTDFTVYYLSKSRFFSSRSMMSLAEKLYYYASDDAISESPTDGDYIRWAVSAYGFSGVSSQYYANGYYYYTLDLKYVFYDSAEEEKEVDRVVNSFVSSIDANSMTDYEIIKSIHDFICSKTTYDDDAISSIKNREYSTTAYGALVKGLSICQGYAVAFYRLCKELGYNVRFVSSDATWGCHAWNIVQLDGKYYFVDTTWDDSYLEGKTEGSPYELFLVNYENSKSKDSYYGEHELDYHYYEDEYFFENYRELFDENDYNSDNKELFSQKLITLSDTQYVYSGAAFEPEVSVLPAADSETYTVSYSNNIKTGMAAANILSTDNKTLLSHRNFYILPQKMKAPSLETGGRTDTSLKVKWEKPQGSISGYELEILKNGKWSLAKTLSSSVLSAEISSLSPAADYSFKIRAYRKVSNRKLYGSYSNVYKTATKPKKAVISSLTTKSNSISVFWKKESCSGYEIQYSTSKDMKNAKALKTSSSAVSKKISNLKKGRTYYIRVRAYKNYTTASGKKCVCYSLWSAKKSIKCK